MTLGGVTYRSRPVSAEAVRRALAANESDEAIWTLCRMAFPLSWSSVWHGDPARKLFRAPNRWELLRDLVEVPKAAPPTPREPDAWDRLAMANKDPVPQPAGPEITLDTICRLTEIGMGSGWYYNPDRWETADGYAPVDVVAAAWKTMDMARALERLNIVRAVLTTKAGDRAQGMYDADVTEALGG